MKSLNITYWIATGLISLMMAFSAYSYIANPQMAAGFQHLGFPDYFRIELAIAKLIGIVLLLSPVPRFLKEWAYAGFIITFISAFIAHSASGDPASARMMPVIMLIILTVSYISWRRIGQRSSVSRTQRAQIPA